MFMYTITNFTTHAEVKAFIDQLVKINGRERIRTKTEYHWNGTITFHYSILPKPQAQFSDFMNNMQSVDSNYNPYN